MLTRRQPHKAAHKPRGPIRHGGLGTVSLRLFGGIGLDLMLAVLAPNDQPDAGGGSVAERHWRAAKDMVAANAAAICGWKRFMVLPPDGKLSHRQAISFRADRIDCPS